MNPDSDVATRPLPSVQELVGQAENLLERVSPNMEMRAFFARAAALSVELARVFHALSDKFYLDNPQAFDNAWAAYDLLTASTSGTLFDKTDVVRLEQVAAYNQFALLYLMA